MQKTFLLTGATSGIGFGILQQLVQEGHKIYAVGRNFEKIESFVKSYPTQIVRIKSDLSKIEDIGVLFENSFEDQKFDGLIHCAGTEETLPLSFYSVEKVKSIFDINTFAGIELLRHFTKKKYSIDGASIVLFSSVMGSLGQPGKIGYCASKSAVLGVVRASALEFAKRKIRINAVSPGIVNTPMSDKLFDQLDEKNISKIKEMHPLGLGEVEDVANVVSFLLSDKSRWITGQDLVIDGGYSIQ